MKKISILICILAMVVLVGCKTTTKTYEADMWGTFTIVEKRNNMEYGELTICYDNDSKAMYYLWNSASRAGMCPIYDKDGRVKLYKGE